MTRFSEAEKELILRRIKRENTVFYPALKIVNFKPFPVAKKPDILSRVKRYFTVILNVTFTRIYNDILDKKLTKSGFFKLIKRPGKKGRGRNRPRQSHEPESIFYSRKEAMADIA